jgi:hypothetical protein
MGRVCQKRVVALFIDKSRQTDVKTVSPNGLLLCTPISIVMTLLPLDRSDHHLKTDRPRSVKTDTFTRLVSNHAFGGCQKKRLEAPRGFLKLLIVLERLNDLTIRA